VSNDESDLDLLKKQISKLNLEIEKKNIELADYLEKIQDNEEEIMKLHELISKTPSQENIQEAIELRTKYELKEKDREIRDLKNRMGFLRREMIQYQKELEDIKIKEKSSAISIERIRDREKILRDLLNLENSMIDFRRKLYKQEMLIDDYKKEVDIKDAQIKELTSNIEVLNRELSIKTSILERKIDKQTKKELRIKLQKQLKDYKKEIDDLRNELKTYKTPEGKRIKDNIEILELKNKIQLLEEQLDEKIGVINKLRSQKEKHSLS
jgi:chromosome segregation ATPase